VTEPDLRTIATTVHGRYLVAPATGSPIGVLVGFHGYAETAAIHLEALRAITGSDRWLVVAVQALHPFYTRDERVVASWMTGQDRDLAIADNLEYVRRVVDTVTGEQAVHAPRVFVGFSQGGAMAYRAAAEMRGDGLIILAADVPPDVADRPAVQLPAMLLGRGTTDSWYTAERSEADLATLKRLGVPVEACVFEGGHEWGIEFREAVTRYLAQFA
jgi:predicted esterase